MISPQKIKCDDMSIFLKNGASLNGLKCGIYTTKVITITCRK